MTSSNFKLSKILISGYVLVLTVISLVTKNAFLMSLGVITGVAMLRITAKKNRVITTDERAQFLAGKAAYITLVIIVSSLTLFSLMLLAFGHDKPYVSSLGQIFSYLSSLVLVIYVLVYQYYSKLN